MTPYEIDEKTERLQRMLATEGLDAVLLNAQHNFAWLTGGGTNGVRARELTGIWAIRRQISLKNHLFFDKCCIAATLPCDKISFSKEKEILA